MVFALAALALAAVAGFFVRRMNSHLERGRKAPDFSAYGALGGDVHSFSLREALTGGPVVLCFYPKSFTSGCTIEMRAFASRIDDFAAAGATIVGVSRDSVETQRRFSDAECGGRLLLLSDPGFIAKRYGVALAPGMSNRTSYVIAPDGKITESFSSMFEPLKHVETTLAAVQRLEAEQRPIAGAAPAEAGRPAPGEESRATRDGSPLGANG